MEASQYRFYPESLPSQGDFVMVQVTSLTSMGIYVVLLEYGQAEGMIVASEMSKKRIRSVHKIFKLGQILCCLVIRVDGVKGYIDLSKRRVTQEDTSRCVARYSRAKCVHSIIIRTAELLGLTKEQQIYELYSHTAWHLNNGVTGKMKKKVAAYGIFFQSLRDREALNSCPIDDQTRTVLLTTIQTRLHENKVHIKACISVRCNGADGVEAIKEALKEGLKFATEDVPIKILYLQAPLYTVTAEVSELMSRSSTDALQRIDEAISAVGQKILSFDGGIFAIESKPKVVKKRHNASAGNCEDDNFPSDSDDDNSDDPDDGDYFSDSHNGLDDSDTHNGSKNDDTDLEYVSEKLIGACGLADEDSGLGKDI